MKTNLATLFITLLLMGVVFAVDVMLPPRIAAGVGYVLAVAVSFSTHVRSFPLGVALCCSALLLIGFSLGPSGPLTNEVLANQFLALFAIWVTAVLTSRLQGMLFAANDRANSTPPALADALPRPEPKPPAVSRPSEPADAEPGGIRDRDLLESLLRNVPENIYFKDREGRFLRINRAKAERSGLKDPQEAVGKTDFDFFSRAHAEKTRRDEQQILKTEKPIVGLEEKLVWPDGKETWSLTTKVPLHDRHGQVVGTLGISRDITRQKDFEEALRRSHARFRRLVDSDIVGIMVTSATGLVTESNNAFLEIVGYTREDLQAGLVRWDQMTPPEHRKLDQHALDELARTGHCDPWEKEYVRKDGRRVPVLLGVTSLDPETTECLCFVLNMTEQKKIEAELRAARQVADAASKAKSDFLANMSHEIRTPMNAIIGISDLLTETTLTKAQRDYLNIVAESGESLLALLNDILDFSKIEAGKLDLHPISFDLREHLGDALKSLALRAHRKGLELASSFAPEVPLFVVGDPDRLRQIVINLTGNAIKFTETGEVILQVELDPEEHPPARWTANARFQPGDDVVLKCTVRDTGIGIPSDKLDTIFGAFEQADTSTTRRFGGTGLGLSISKRLVELMHGRLGVQSEVGQGSRFSFVIKLQCGDPGSALARQVEPAHVRGTRVLVVDDNATNRRILEEMLRSWGMEPASARGVFEALDRLREAQRIGLPFRLVVSDVNMPDVDGFTLAEQLKKDPTLTDVIVMMLTSGDRPEDLARCDRLGIAAHLMKPIKQSELFDAIMLALGVTKPEPDVKQGKGDLSDQAHLLPPLKILLAEDSLPNQKLAIGLLRKWKHRVTVAQTGLEAIEAVAGEAFDLVLMDVQMPEMDGLQATKTIRARERGTNRHVPIVAMTAHAMKGDRELCLEAGMDGYLPKPIRPQELLAALLKALPNRVIGESPSAKSPNAPPVSPRLDWRQALETVEGDRDLLRTVAEAFLDECPVLIQQLRRAVAMGDAESVQKITHTIKGSAKTIGGIRTAHLAADLEDAARRRNLTHALDDWQTLKIEIESLCDDLTDFVTKKDEPVL